VTLVERLRAAGCVFAEDEAALLQAEATDAGHLESMVQRRVAGEPLEVIVGWAEFAGRRLAVAPGVFVPRRRTEYLATVAVSLLRPGDTVLDLCCGVGAIGSVLLEVDDIRLHASDIDPVAVDCARRNLPGATTYAGDLFDPIPPDLRFDLIAANAPYVPSDEVRLMPREARLFELPATLDGGGDGLALHRRIAIEAVGRLAPGGWLLIETSEAQLPTAVELMLHVGLDARSISDEELDTHVVLGQRAA
jgi:release factor glutamine methyltransferase